MSKHILKSIKKLVEDNGTKNIVIFTSHLKIEGEIFIPDGKCEECLDEFIAIQKAQVCRINDYCTCNEDECECNDYICFRYEWLNINISDIVAFSIVYAY